MDYKARLEKQIEELRIRMYEIYNQNPTDEELVQISQELDELLNKFGKYKRSLPSKQN
ncbi:aspartyl-phosphate phosphatase Spo0E family protein [Halobacillus sp. K22]|uniref:aspartyl-phosphate phosphatase Spo0E family protein n=1 Tax=Halobacillus sp. K22 TaxID=3457431 RepID=UPI003FCC556A